MSEAGAGETEGGAGGATFIGQVHQEGATPARMVPPPSTWGQTVTVPVTKGFLPSGLPGDSEHTHHNPAPLPTARLPRWGGRGVWAASGPQPQRLETGGHTSPRLPPPRGPRAELPGDHCTGGPPLARSRPLREGALCHHWRSLQALGTAPWLPSGSRSRALSAFKGLHGLANARPGAGPRSTARRGTLFTAPCLCSGSHERCVFSLLVKSTRTPAGSGHPTPACETLSSSLSRQTRGGRRGVATCGARPAGDPP